MVVGDALFNTRNMDVHGAPWARLLQIADIALGNGGHIVFENDI